MGITIEKDNIKTYTIGEIPIGGTFKYNGIYYIKIEYVDEDEDGDEEMIMVSINLLTGKEDIHITSSTLIIPIELIMREKTDV